jgi:hypothetical protein
MLCWFFVAGIESWENIPKYFFLTSLMPHMPNLLGFSKHINAEKMINFNFIGSPEDLIR